MEEQSRMAYPAGKPRPILITGPTASGKSAFALSIAERFSGVIINADSMQVYGELQVLTARPDDMDLARAPHRLYGHVPAREAYSVARWLVDVEEALAQAAAARQRPVIVGGTGLYFKALIEGLSPVPEIPSAVRAYWRERAGEISASELHAELAQRDPVMAERLHPSDRQRVTRALEVIAATGRSLRDWQGQSGQPLLPLAATVPLLVQPDRTELHRRCDARFEQMVARGALDEVAVLAEQRLPDSLPAMRAIGVPALLAHIRGELTLAEAVARGQLETRQYMKRQETWLKRNNSAWIMANTINICEIDK